MDDINDLYKRFITGNEKYPNFSKTTKLAKTIAIHADGLIPEELINERRPCESEAIKDYRKKIYAAITKNPINKVITSLGKIRRSADWSIRYEPDSVPPTVTNASLEDYCEYNYPGFTSITNWVFSELLKCYLIDANGLYACVPLTIPQSNTEYLNPVAYFFPSEQILAYEPNEYAVVLSSEKSRYTSPQGRNIYNDGKVYYIIDTERVVKYEQSSRGGDYIITYDYQHDLGYLPADKVGGLFLHRANNDIVYESRINAMIINLNEAAREYSDLQAELVQHIHSEKYEYATSECPVCNGSKVGKDDDGKPCLCKSCGGQGKVTSTSPYGVHVITMSKKLEEYQIPTPPIGYIFKNVEVVKVQMDRIKELIYGALASINMEFLAEVPLSQSGVAKEVDRDELNNFVNGIAEDIVRVMDNVYKWICDLRYSFAVPDADKRQSMLPVINVPERYDLLSTNHLMTEITSMRNANANPLVIRALEVDFVKKKFNANPDIGNELQVVLDLDPLPGISADEKMSYYSEGVIREIDYVISANIVRFVRMAFEADKKFFSKSYNERVTVLEVYAQEVINENDIAVKLKTELNPVPVNEEYPTGN